MFFFFSFFSLPRPNRLQDSDGEKSDQDLVVDIANETVSCHESFVKQFKPKRKKIKLSHKQLHKLRRT